MCAKSVSYGNPQHPSEAPPRHRLLRDRQELPVSSGLAPSSPALAQHASTVGYTRQLWEAIQATDIHGNDALDALAQPSPNG